MKLLIAGSRTFDDYELFQKVIIKIKTPITEIVSGMAKGTKNTIELCEEYGIVKL